ncbi:acyl-[ACP]--phospholipid O-acyltransferase [Verrucomicrobiota bacterium]
MSNSKFSRSFAWMNVTQFLGALNDNVFKFLVVFFVLSLMGDQHKTTIIAVTTVLFVLPFLLFSQAAGVLADRISKRTIIVLAKYIEAGVMLMGCLAVFLKAPLALYGLVFLMSTQSALFGPSKYGIIPELVRTDQLSRANGLVVGATYLAVIIGTFIPSFMLDIVFPESFLGVGFFCVGVAAIGILASRRIEKTPAYGSEKKIRLAFVVEIYKTLREVGKDRYLLLAIFAAAYFPFIGGFMQQNILLYAHESLGMTWYQSGYLFPIAALGIVAGALLAGWLSGRNIEFGVVPLGALGLTLTCIAMHVVTPNLSTILFIIFLVGVSGGLFIVPLDAFIQFKSPERRRGEVIACVNFLGFTGVALSAGAIKVFDSVFGMTPGQGFLVMGVLTAVLSVATLVVLPDFFVRFIIVLVTRLVYRIHVRHPENLPVTGPALLVSNHVTWVDSLLLGATTQRRIRYVMGREIFNNCWMKPLFKLMGVIPISPKDGPRAVVASLKKARAALDDGYLVCIFAEGAITRNGNMQDFKPGLERIVKGTDYPIIPVHLGGAWGSIFSYFHGRLVSSLPTRVPYHVSVTYGAPMPASSTSFEIRQAVLELSTGSFDILHPRGGSLARMFARSARRNWFRPAMADTTGKRLTFGRALSAALALCAEMKQGLKGQDKVGVLLPASVGGALTNIALTLLGKVPVNLNFTASEKAFASSIRQCEIRTIISSRVFLEKLGSGTAPTDGCETVFLEDIAGRISKARKLAAMLKALFWPIRLLGRGIHARGSDPATVIFSSGSTGEPKGVMLSHRNIISDIESFSMIYRFRPDDRMCAVLPFFHSFGLTCTFWCPLANGFSAYYHPNPLDGSKIAEIVRERGLTILLATPTFLLAYIRRAGKEDFASLRIVMAGAEKLTKRVADSFEKKCGIRPLEGYGATELSPAAAMNVPDTAIDRVSQTGTKQGSIGHPLPGVAMRIVDIETSEPVQADEPGLLMVKGANVMLGYLDMPEETGEVLRDGWYDTGDVARMDRDGFVFLQDRLSRHSKIAGEMVPHIAVEEKYLHALGSVERIVAVSSGPDENRGEQLVVFYLGEAGDPDTLHKIVSESDLPNLWKPKKGNYHRIDSLPTLGSGKLDLMCMRQMAREFVERKGGTYARAGD